MPKIHATHNRYDQAYLKLQQAAIRSYYYTATPGDDEKKLHEARTGLRTLGFQPEVFKKEKGTKSKGVDITLAKDMLSHCFLGNYDVAVLFAGDGDYVPLVNEIKRMGKVVYVPFFEQHGLNDKLALAADCFFDLESEF
jgi:uncharacterized LabA/DUF88 family protein